MANYFFFHTDLDGLGIYTLIKYFNIKYEGLYSFNYNEYDEYEQYLDQLKPEDTIIFADISPIKKWMEIIESKNCIVKIYDHHGSELELDSAYDLILKWKYDKLEYKYDTIRCGTHLFYDYYIRPTLSLSKPIIEEYIKIVSGYDCGLINVHPYYELGVELNRLFWKMKSWGTKGLESYDYFVKSMTYKFDNLTEWKYNRLEEKKIQEDVNREKEIFNKLISGGTSTLKTRKDEKGNYFCIMRLRSKASGICNLLFDKYSKLMYCIVINEFDKENLKLSLRSRQGFNLTDLQEIHGHEGAAGYENVTNEICNDLWENKIHSFKYRLKD